jgi:hypothetical protein
MVEEGFPSSDESMFGKGRGAFNYKEKQSAQQTC